MDKTITGSMEYMLWQLRKLPENSFIILDNGDTFVKVRMCETNWIKW